MKSIQTTIAFALALAAAPYARATTFHFTVTADSRGQRTGFRNTLSEILRILGDEGVFHVSPGDIDPLTDNYADLVAKFGSDVIWYPGVGNHEQETAEDMQWIRDFYPNLPNIVRQGPPGAEKTTYSFEYGNAHFVMLNEYYNGSSDIAADGDVGNALYDWLAADLSATTKPVKIVFGHEPAFPANRHVGDSLDAHTQNRDRFWSLLTEKGVVAYICGHTHYYSTHHTQGTSLWQIDVGNAGNGSPQTFLDVTVTDSSVTFDTWEGTGTFALRESWSVEGLASPTPAQPTVTLTPTSTTIAEDSVSPAALTLTRDGDLGSPLAVALQLSGTASLSGAGADALVSTAGTVSIPAGQAAVQVTVTPVDDLAVEGDESVVVEILPSTAYLLGNARQATVTIQDDELATAPPPGDTPGTTPGDTAGDGSATPAGDTSATGDGAVPGDTTSPAGGEEGGGSEPATTSPSPDDFAASAGGCAAAGAAPLALGLWLPLAAAWAVWRRRRRPHLDG